jgi:hypothetical protein
VATTIPTIHSRWVAVAPASPAAWFRAEPAGADAGRFRPRIGRRKLRVITHDKVGRGCG